MTCARYLTLAGLLWLVLTSISFADSKAGIEAYKRGDYETAFKEWRVGAEEGKAYDQYNLAALYAMGQGVPQDYVEAYVWLNRAAAQGFKRAVEFRDDIAKQMTPWQIAEAQRLSRASVPRQWTWSADMNGDKIISISDVWAWLGWLFYYPGDLLMDYTIIHQTWAARFLELTPADYQGRLSFVLSFFGWTVAGLAIFACRSWLRANYPLWREGFRNWKTRRCSRTPSDPQL